MKQMNFDTGWHGIENHGIPCKILLLCDYKKTYTGPGAEYTPLWSVENKNVPLQIDEIKRGKNNMLWGRLKTGDGWIDLKNVRLFENN